MHITYDAAINHSIYPILKSVQSDFAKVRTTPQLLIKSINYSIVYGRFAENDLMLFS